MQVTSQPSERKFTARMARIMTGIEEAIYGVIALMLALAAIGILVSLAVDVVSQLSQEASVTVFAMLDQLLLVLMLVEILHTVGISLREHVLMSESFLTVGLIAAIRRVLVITAEQPKPSETAATEFQLIMLELGLLTLLILALAVAIYILRKRATSRSGQVEPGNEPGTYILRQADGSRTVLVPAETSTKDGESAEQRR